MVSIAWCKKQGKGIRFAKPNSIIAEDYVRKADEALQMLDVVPSNEWKAVAAYYACYNIIYALLQKAGVICEIHDCTPALMKFFEYTDEQIHFIENLKIQRVNAQYYTNKPFMVENSNAIQGFVLDGKQKLQMLPFEYIKKRIEEECRDNNIKDADMKKDVQKDEKQNKIK